MSAGRWTVKAAGRGWVVDTPTGHHIFWASNLKIAHTAARTYAEQEALNDVRKRYRRIISQTWPSDLRDLITSDMRDELAAQGDPDADEDMVSEASEALMRLMENGGDLDE